MTVGIIKKWKQPLGFFFTAGPINCNSLSHIMEGVISMLTSNGYIVHGITTDQGSNFQKFFRTLGLSARNSTVLLGDETLFVCRDPPHLLKCARNFLMNGPVNVPGHAEPASWQHLKMLYDADQKSSLNLAPKLTRRHLINVKFQTSMKVKSPLRCYLNPFLMQWTIVLNDKLFPIKPQLQALT